MQPASLELPHRRRLPVDRINHHALTHGIAVASLHLDGPVDRSRFYVCPSLTPLTYTAVFAELTAAQQLRYNQLVGMLYNEMNCFFEEEIGGCVLPALLARSDDMRPELATSLAQFLKDEQQHTQMFRRLNRLAQPDWYATRHYHILRLPRPFLAGLHALARRPLLFPMIFWLMLFMEERALLFSRRDAAMDQTLLEPHFAATYRAHGQDEVRHVQIDWHLLDEFYRSRPLWQRRVNARILEGLMVTLFLKPRRGNVRAVELLVDDHPELRPKRRALLTALRGLDENPDYRRMMYSPEATPISGALLARLPEMAKLRRRVYREDAH